MRSIPRALGAFLAAPLLLAACSKPARQAPAPVTPATPKAAEPETPTRVLAFGVAVENLNVDQVGMRDGNLKPDGGRDHVFTATIEGPFEALFITECDEKGNPTYGFRGDTLAGGQELPQPLGGVIDTGEMTIGMGVVEKGRFVNGERGTVSLGEGTHVLTIYAPNAGLLAAGDHLRLYVRVAGGALVPGPVTTY